MGKTVVLGVGNVLLKDEGLGVRALEILKENYEFPEGVELLDGGTLGMDLLYYLEGADRLVILDAVSGGGPPGTLYRFTDEEVRAYFKRKVSAHEIGIQEVLALLDLLEKPVKSVAVLGIEPKDLNIGTDLSPEVESSLGELVKATLDLLKEWGLEVKPKKEVVS